MLHALDTHGNAAHSVWFAVSVISDALHEGFVHIKNFHSVSQFLLFWMRIICCIYKVFVRPGVCYHPSFIHVRVKINVRFCTFCANIVRRSRAGFQDSRI